MRAAGPPTRSPLAKGTYPEVEVRAKSIGWKGKIDLLVLGDDACEITDFKTGAADEAHKFQVRVYAVLWRLELKITGRHGPTSWDAVVMRARNLPVKTPALLRLQQPDEFKTGTRVRVLDGALARDPEADAAPAIVTLSALSEAYRVE